eukprot:306619-Pyramimonas_sp.AAC.1
MAKQGPSEACCKNRRRSRSRSPPPECGTPGIRGACQGRGRPVDDHEGPPKKSLTSHLGVRDEK